MLETRVVARLAKIGRICVVAKSMAASVSATAENAKTDSSVRRVARRR